MNETEKTFFYECYKKLIKKSLDDMLFNKETLEQLQDLFRKELGDHNKQLFKKVDTCNKNEPDTKQRNSEKEPKCRGNFILKGKEILFYGCNGCRLGYFKEDVLKACEKICRRFDECEYKATMCFKDDSICKAFAKQIVREVLGNENA